MARGLGDLLGRHGDKAPLSLFMTYVAALDTLNRRQRAQEVFEQAWKLHPDSRELRHLAKQRHLVIP